MGKGQSWILTDDVKPGLPGLPQMLEWLPTGPQLPRTTPVSLSGSSLEVLAWAESPCPLALLKWPLQLLEVAFAPHVKKPCVCTAGGGPMSRPPVLTSPRCPPAATQDRTAPGGSLWRWATGRHAWVKEPQRQPWGCIPVELGVECDPTSGRPPSLLRRHTSL